MTTFLAIDPGQSSGWAFFDEKGTLTNCYGGNPPILNQMPVKKTLIECPFIPPKRRNKNVDPNDLIKLAVITGRFAERLEHLCSTVELVFPATWTGQMDKDVCHAQYWPTFSERERAIIKAKGQGLNEKARGDLLDAVCLGKWGFKTGRLG